MITLAVMLYIFRKGIKIAMGKLRKGDLSCVLWASGRKGKKVKNDQKKGRCLKSDTYN
jgi:hypothetical protein